MYGFTKFKNITENKLLDPIYTKTVYEDGKVTERFIEKDFPITKKEILKNLPEQFYKQAPQLMKGQQYRRDYGDIDFDREFDSKEAKQESKFLQSLINKNEVNIDQIYIEENRASYYRVIFYIDWRRWGLEINPKTGNIQRITFGLLIE